MPLLSGGLGAAVGAVEPAARVVEGIADADEDLADPVVQLACHAATLLFLGVEHALGQLLELGIGEATLAQVQAHPGGKTTSRAIG